MQSDKGKVKLTFIEPLLGGASNNPEVHAEFIASKAPTVEEGAEETAAIGQTIEKAMTVFPRDENGLFYWNYQLRGFFKENLHMLCELGEIKEVSKWQVKRAVDFLIYVAPRRIPILGADGKRLTEAKAHNTRPLRATTLQGDRVALATSEELVPGCSIEFGIELLRNSNPKSKLKISQESIQMALELGARRGFGQWRNAEWGRFEFKIEWEKN